MTTKTHLWDTTFLMNGVSPAVANVQIVSTTRPAGNLGIQHHSVSGVKATIEFNPLTSKKEITPAQHDGVSIESRRPSTPWDRLGHGEEIGMMQMLTPTRQPDSVVIQAGKKAYGIETPTRSSTERRG